MGKQRTSRPQAYKAPILGSKKTRPQAQVEKEADALLTGESCFAEGELEGLVDRIVDGSAIETSRLVPVAGLPSLKPRNLQL